LTAVAGINGLQLSFGFAPRARDRRYLRTPYSLALKRQGPPKKECDSKRVKTEKKEEEGWNDPEKVLGDGNCETY
jgi:hypothetical protein